MLSSPDGDSPSVDRRRAFCDGRLRLREDLERELAVLHPSCFGWALACCARDRSEASDVLQDVYFKVLSGRARWDGRAALKTWLFGVIRLTALEQRRFRWMRGREVPTPDGE